MYSGLGNMGSLDKLRQEALCLLNNATTLDGQGRIIDAEECYCQGIVKLQQILQSPATPQSERGELMPYLSKAAARVQYLRARIRGEETSKAMPQQSPPGRPSPAAAAPQGEDYLSFLDEPAYRERLRAYRTGPGAAAAAGRTPATPPVATGQPPSPSPASGSRGGGGGGGDAAGPSSGSSGIGGAVDLPPPVPDEFLAQPERGPAAARGQHKDVEPDWQPQPADRLLRDHFTPRISKFVYKAIDTATALTEQGELKRAVDVLQHAYHVGSRERNNPSNFNVIKETLHAMRQRYYKQHPPRFLQDNPLLPSEMAVLRKSGITSTILLPMWDDVREGYGAENVFMPSEGIWEDAFFPTLCEAQRKNGAQPMHAVALVGGRERELAIIRTADPMKIQQSVVGDCSLVCSLIICASYQKRFPKARIITNVIYPQDRSGNPIVNPKGKYCVKMLINGMTRIVTIDDRLPANIRKNTLLCTHSSDATELWVPLMEKAFVKVCGGSYDFPGSTSGNDLYKLSGWLPDRVTFDDADFDMDFQWRRLFNNFTAGALLLTLVTGETAAGAPKPPLPSCHSYAVLDIRELSVADKRLRVVQIRNPWCKQTWDGALSIKDTSDTAKAVHAAFAYDKAAADCGLFVMLWEDVARFLSRAYLSWNPYMLFRTEAGEPRKPTRLACHSTFPYSTSMGAAPQVHIGVVGAAKRTRMHLVFSRHIHDVAEFGRDADGEDEATPYISLHVFDVTGTSSVAQCIGGRCVHGMCYCRRLYSRSDLPHRLVPLNDPVARSTSSFTVSFDCPPGTTQLLVVVKRSKSKAQATFNFTVTLHTELEQMRLPTSDAVVASTSMADFNDQLETANAGRGDPNRGVFMHLIPHSMLKHTSTVAGAWEKGKTCGGREDASTMVYNPQYLLTLQRPALFCAKLIIDGTDESCSLAVCKRRALQLPEAALKKLTFAPRIGNIHADADLRLSPKLYSFDGCCVDSALPDTLVLDRTSLLGNRAKAVSRKIEVRFAKTAASEAFFAGKGQDAFTMYDFDPSDEAVAVLIAALGKGYPVSFSRTTITAEGGRRVQLTDPLRSLVSEAAAAASGSSGRLVLSLQLSLNNDEVCAVGLPDRERRSTPTEALFAAIVDALENLQSRASQVRTYMLQLSNYQRRVEQAKPPVAPAPLRAYLLDLCEGGLACIKRELGRADRPAPAATPPPCLPPLPAGEYVLIPSLWSKGAPGTFRLTVETTEPHSLQPIPAEGAGHTEKSVSAQFIPKGTPLDDSGAAPRVLPKSDPFFLNSKTSVQLSTRGTFVCRLLMLQDAVDSEKDGWAKARPPLVNVSLFRVRDAATMEMVATSGRYTNTGGVATAPVVLEPNTAYLAVVSASQSSSGKYVLRMYSDAAYNAQLVQ